MLQLANRAPDAFVHALGVRDFDALEGTFASEVRFRALVPPGLREAGTRGDARRYYESWFGDLARFEMVGHTVIPVAHRVHVAYRLHFIDEGIPKVCEQRIFMTPEPSGITVFDLVCSGFLPLA